MYKDLIYVLPKKSHSEDYLRKCLLEHPEIRFVSLVGVDLSGNNTDERYFWMTSRTSWREASRQTAHPSCCLGSRQSTTLRST